MAQGRIVIFGGLGKVGRALVRQSVDRGVPTTVAVRRPDECREAFGEEVVAAVRIHEVDSLDPRAVGAAMRDADVAINSAGHSKMGEAFLRICDVFMEQSERLLPGDKRVWLLGGLAALDVPNTRYRGDDLMVPAAFKIHRKNRERLEASQLSWSMACPGPMVDGYAKPRSGSLRVSIDRMPIDFPEAARRFPKWMLTGALLARVRETRVSYDDVAGTIIDRLRDAAFERKRVGFALPAGGAS